MSHTGIPASSLSRISRALISLARESLYTFLSPYHDDFQLTIYGSLNAIGLTLCHIGAYNYSLKFFIEV